MGGEAPWEDALKGHPDALAAAVAAGTGDPKIWWGMGYPLSRLDLPKAAAPVRLLHKILLVPEGLWVQLTAR